MDETISVGLRREDVVEKAKEHVNFLGQLCLPEVFTLLFPPIYLAVWQMLTQGATQTSGMLKLCLGLPRGFAKTILLKLFVIYLILFTDRRFILIVCNTASLAENFIADIEAVMTSRNILRVFGDWRTVMTKDTQPLKKFVFNGRTVVLAGLGAQSSLRGIQLDFQRPDVILMDDMQSREQAKSEPVAKELLDWMLGTLMKANNKKRCLFVFIGNMYPYEGSILRKLRQNPAWISFICGAILEDGESIWPELRSVESLMDEFEDDLSMGVPEIFFAEVMNDDSAGSRSGIDISKIKIWRPAVELEADAGFVIIDPSGRKKTSDATAIGGVLVYGTAKVLSELDNEVMDPMTTIRKAISMAFKIGVQAIVFESVGYQASLGFWMERVRMSLGISHMRELEITPGGLNKNARISAALKDLAAPGGEIFIAPNVRAAVVHQIVYWDPLSTKNKDDILDIVAYIPRVVQVHQHMLLRTVIEAQHSEGSTAETLQLGF